MCSLGAQEGPAQKVKPASGSVETVQRETVVSSAISALYASTSPSFNPLVMAAIECSDSETTSESSDRPAVDRSVRWSEERVNELQLGVVMTVLNSPPGEKVG